MSAGVASLSDDELLRQLGRTGYPTKPLVGRMPAAAPAAPAAPAMPEAANDPGALPILVRPNNQPQPEAAPALAGGVAHLSNEELMRQLGATAPKPATFDERFAGEEPAGPAPKGLAEGLRAQADERLVGPPSIGNSLRTAASQFSNTVGLNLPRNAAAGIATLAGKAGISGFNPDFDANYRRAKQQDEALDRQNPAASWTGFGLGLGAGAVALPALSGAATLPGRIRQGALTAGGYSAAGEFADSKDLGRAAFAGGVGLGAGGLMTGAVEIGARALAPIVRRGQAVTTLQGGFTDEAQAALREAGLDPANLPPALTNQLRTTFGIKGVSPAAIREAQAAEFGIPLSRSQAAQDKVAAALEQESASGLRGPRAQTIAEDFSGRQTAAIGSARDRVVSAIAEGGPIIETPAIASEKVADVARAMSEGNASRVAGLQRGADDALGRVRPASPPDPLDAGASVIAGVREAADRSRAGYRGAYADVGALEGEFAAGALDRLGARVRDRLGPEVPIDDVLTPAASRALADLDNLPALFRTEPGTGPTAPQFEQLRKRLVTYRGMTGQNATDRRAVDRIIGEVDAAVEDAMAAGLFGPRQPRAPADDFPGTMPAEALPAAREAPTGRERAPESLTQWLGRNGGIAVDGDARAGDLQRVMTGYGPLARSGGRSLDDLRPRLIEEGYLPPDRDGGMARNVGDEVFDLIRRERAGERTYRIQDRERAAGLDVGGRAADRSNAYAERVAEASSRITADLESVGMSARDLDGPTLREAAEALVRGEADDAFAAYEAAVMNRAASAERSPVTSDVPFDGPTVPSASSSLPVGDAAPAETMRKAREAFAAHRRQFSPQGAGDDAGRAVQRIVERGAEPNEVAAMLFGSSRVGNTGLSLRATDKLKGILGEESAAWADVRQALITRVLDGRGRGDVVGRLDDVLEGEARTLAGRVLTPQQIGGLRAYRDGLRQVAEARAEVPEWVSALAKRDFDPNAVTARLFGAGVPGSRVGATAFLKAARGFLDEEAWSALRQASWMRLGPEGGATTPAKEAGRILAFVKGEGAAFAREMFSREERDLMVRYAEALKATVAPEVGAREQAGRTAQAAAHALNLLFGAIGFKVGGMSGGLGAYGAQVGHRALVGGANGLKASRSFLGGAPKAPAPPVFDGAGLSPTVGLVTGAMVGN